MAKLANKRIYIIKERASRECHTEENTDLCSVRENKDILQGRQTLYSYLQTLIYGLPVPIYLCLIVYKGISTIANKVSPRGVTALTRAVSGEKQIYSGNLEILPGIEKPGKFFGKYEVFSGH